MDQETTGAISTQQPTPSAFRFNGIWQDFAKIAFPNLLLAIVTLGIYRFWGTTREREYLWSKTDFIDEPLEWTGRGIELFIGFVVAFFLIILPLVFLQFGVQALTLQGHPVIAIILGVLAFVMIFYLSGVARFRALRYRLSRTYWRGIRGGSDEQGLSFAVSYMWKTFVGWLPLYLMVPWSMITLWNERWNAMSFGPYRFSSNASWTSLMKRYLLFYLVPFLLFVGAIILAISEHAKQGSGEGGGPLAILGVVFIIFAVLAVYILLPIASLLFFSKFYRVAVGGLRLQELEFEFKARAADWILLFLGHIGVSIAAYTIAAIPISILSAATLFDLKSIMQGAEVSVPTIIALGVAAAIAILPLGMVSPLVRYRNWKFFVTHMEVYGEINLDTLTQSETASPSQGEGLLDAFDVGAI